MLDLDCHVVGELGEPAVQQADHGERMSGAVEEIRVAEGDVLCPAGHLLGDVVDHHVRLNHAEPAALDRYDRTVAEQELASPRLLGVPPSALSPPDTHPV